MARDRTAAARAKYNLTRRALTLAQRFYPKVAASNGNGCQLWTGSTAGTGYGNIGLRTKPGEPITTKVGAHVASYMLHKGPVPKGMVVMHKCDVRACVNPDHLQLSTQADNARDCVAKRRHTRGEMRPHSIMTWVKVRQLRAEYLEGATQVQLAAKFGISQPAVSQIVRAVTWEEDGLEF